MEKEEQLLKKRILELAELSYKRGISTHTDFLNLSEQTIFYSVSGMLPPVSYVLTGGFLFPERKVAVFYPEGEDEPDDLPFECIKISPVSPRFSENLTHRDYLGAIMNLGITRAMIGDIVIKDLDAYCFVLKKISPYICENLTTVRHTTVSAAPFDGEEGFPEPEYEEMTGSLSSLRLDSITVLCARLSRTKAAALITAERVFINGRLETSASKNVGEGDIISIRGIGKFRIASVGGTTKKGRTIVTVYKYK